MAFDKGQPKEIDLDSTDRLPILEGISIDDDVEDDSERLEFSATMPGTSIVATPPPEYRPSGLDLPSLAESVRSVEERIARQNADYEALNRLYEKARDAQLAAGTRADILASELGTAHSALAVEQHRVRELQTAVAETNAAAEQTRARAEEAMRESERAQSEARTLREALVARDTSIAQTLHSLGERDAQLFALQREHAKVVPDLEARSQASARLDREVKEAKERAEALARDLEASRQAVSQLTDRIARAESELKANRRELAAAKLQSESYLEILRTRDWRGGFNQNMFREWDDKIAVEQRGRGALQAECDRLKLMAAALNTKVAEQNETLEKLSAAKVSEAAAFAKKAQETQEIERSRAELLSQIAEANAERKRVEAELAARAKDVADLRSQTGVETQRAKDAVAAAEAAAANLAARIEELETESKTHEEEMTVLMAHLNEARRPIQGAQADFKRVSDELAQKIVSLEQLSEENRTLRTGLERTRGAARGARFVDPPARAQREQQRQRARAVADEHRAARRHTRRGPQRIGGLRGGARAHRLRAADHLYVGAAHPHRPGAGLRAADRFAVGEPQPRHDLKERAGAHRRGLEQHQRRVGERAQGHPAPPDRWRHAYVGEIQFRCVLKFKAPEGATDEAPAGAPAASTAVTNLSDVRPGDAPKGEPRP